MLVVTQELNQEKQMPGGQAVLCDKRTLSYIFLQTPSLLKLGSL